MVDKGLLSTHYGDHTIPSCLWNVHRRDMIFDIASGVDWRVITDKKQRQVDIENVQENARRVTHNYAVAYLVYAEMVGIYRKLYYKNQGPYRIT